VLEGRFDKSGLMVHDDARNWGAWFDVSGGEWLIPCQNRRPHRLSPVLDIDDDECSGPTKAGVPNQEIPEPQFLRYWLPIRIENATLPAPQCGLWWNCQCSEDKLPHFPLKYVD
jgi:hypothetical protein